MPRRELTSAHYSGNTPLSCDGCGWSGAAREASERRWPEFVAVRCPECDRTIATVLPEPPEPRPAASAYYDFDEERLTCRQCAWSGPGREWSTEMNGGMELFDIYCPKCEARNGFRCLPTHGQIRDAAEAGDRRAIAELPELDRIESSLDRRVASLLSDPAELPDLDGEELELVWDLERGGGNGMNNKQIIRHGEREVWRETAFWESGDRFAQVFTILRRRYGWRLVSLTPTGRSMGDLGGDHFTRDYRRAAEGLANLDPVEGAPVLTLSGTYVRAMGPVELALGSVIDGRGRRFQVLRQGELVVWRASEPSGEPTPADAERLEKWVDGQYTPKVQVTLDG